MGFELNHFPRLKIRHVSLLFKSGIIRNFGFLGLRSAVLISQHFLAKCEKPRHSAPLPTCALDRCVQSCHERDFQTG
jgi:hypothetical protein